MQSGARALRRKGTPGVAERMAMTRTDFGKVEGVGAVSRTAKGEPRRGRVGRAEEETEGI